MSADGDTVREALETDDASFGHPDAITEGALAALARLEAAEAQRDTLAEALRKLANPTHEPKYEDAALLQMEVVEIARAALAEAGLE